MIFRFCLLAVSGISLLLLAACSRTAGNETAYPIGTIWDVPVENGEADWDSASALAQEQYMGFAWANQETAFDVYTFGEGNQQDDVQTAVRSMVEGQAEGTGAPVAALLGATSNEATTRTVALANFFNVPMLVPSASGDNLLSDTNLWAFQLSASNSDYANYLLDTVLNKKVIYQGYEEGFEPEFRIAILYEQNTYGETAAVTTATAALEQSYSVVLYEKFPAETPSVARIRALTSLAIDKDAHLVVMISSNSDVALALTETFTELTSPLLRPVLVGMAAGFTSEEFMESDSMESTYILRQQMDAASCPSEIESLYAAQSYAAMNLLESAADETKGVLNGQEKKIALPLKENEKIALYREALRDALKEADLELPCLGRVAFDNAGQNKFLNFDIVTAKEGVYTIILPEDFIDLLKFKIDISS